MKGIKLRELNSYINELKTVSVLESENVKKGFLDIKRSDYLLNNGKIITREEIIKNGKSGSASVILPITSDNNVILIVQPRVLTTQTVGLELPAGYIETGESPEVAVIRELREETGYVPKRVIKIAEYYQDQGCSRALNHAFIAFGCEKKYDQNLDKDEHIRYFECTYEEALELVEIGYINDANSILTLERSKRYI